MATYLEMKRQAEAMMAQAEAKRREEMAAVVAEIKTKMEEYGLTLADLGAGRAVTRRKSAATAGVEYRGPEGQVWRGGRGPKPRWVKEHLDNGGSLDQLKA